METNFTPGPWKPFRQESKNRLGVKTRFETICVVENPKGTDLYNVDLIAAAPDMFETLTKVYSFMPTVAKTRHETIIKALLQTAINKALGKN